MRAPWMDRAAARAEKIFAKHGVELTLGGEPTYLPKKATGAEWNFAAVGPTKLGYALKVAEKLAVRKLRGAAAFFCPGKSYPGEVNPRWVIRLVVNKDGTPLFQLPPEGRPSSAAGKTLRSAICRALKIPAHWVKFRDRADPKAETWAMPLDHDGKRWITGPWPVSPQAAILGEAEGPAGLRLPLHTIPPELSKRVLTIEKRRNLLAVFLPPLPQPAFLDLLKAIESAAARARAGLILLQGYVPPDEAGRWIQAGLTADPGVLEINLPPCATWAEYADWIEAVTASCESCGLRSWKLPPSDHPAGTGGGNHLLWGGPDFAHHPFFTRPRWLAAILRYWQHHPSLAYLFTGSYVGASSQAPRPDESARDLYDLDMAYAFLESLPPGDHRGPINETLRHLHTDVTGNAHRSEISFDKFWNTAWPSGALGLIEFRAVETFSQTSEMAAIALLWHCLAARLLEAPPPRGLRQFGRKLHDQYFLPTILWNDLEAILADLKDAGFSLDTRIYRKMWAWKFPVLARWRRQSAEITVRKAHESWPLLCETPIEGGTTSRFVDTSMQRLEFLASAEFAKRFEIRVAGRPLPLHEISGGQHLAGLRYRRTNLYPSLHPGIAPQLPLRLAIVDKSSGKSAAAFEMQAGEIVFHSAPPEKAGPPGKPCRGARRSDFTCDLRLP